MQDREEVLSKSKLLKTANIYVSEDLSRKTREHRNELFKYMRFVKRRAPNRKCWNSQISHGSEARNVSRAASAMTKPAPTAKLPKSLAAGRISVGQMQHDIPGKASKG